MTPPWPVEIRLTKDRRRLDVTFDNGECFELPAYYLRVESPSAEMRGHGGKPLPLVQVREDVALLAVVPVGNYAVRLDFDDLHRTGIYSFSYLYTLGKKLS